MVFMISISSFLVQWQPQPKFVLNTEENVLEQDEQVVIFVLFGER